MRMLLAVIALSGACAWGSQHAYIAGFGGTTVTIIDTTTQSVASNVTVGQSPLGIAVNADGSRVYVAEWWFGTMSVMTSSGAIVGGMLFTGQPNGAAFDTAANRVYVAIGTTDSVIAIDAPTQTIVGTVTVAGSFPFGIVVNPASTAGRVYVSNSGNNTVSVLNSAFSLVTAIPVGANPQGMALNPSGTRLYVANNSGDSVSIVSTATNTVIGTIALAPSSAPNGVVVDPSGTNWYVSEGGLNRVEGFSVATNAPVLTVGVGNFPDGIDVDAAGRLYTPNNGDATVTVIQTAPTVTTHTIGPVAPLPIGVGRFIGVGTPDAPTGVSAAPGDTQATVSFSAPLSDGGSPITSYTATCGTQSASGASSPIVVTGLVNGTTVGCTVTATNAIGVGDASSPAVSVTPATVPGAPTGVSAVAGDSVAVVSFSPPASDGGAAITSYLATCGAQFASGASSPLAVPGLANGSPITCIVRALNSAGLGPASAPSNSVTPLGPPGAPTAVVAVAGNAQATVSFVAPTFDGGSAITSYTATCGSQSASGAGLSIVVSGLANGVAVTCTVTATNAIGTGPPSAPSNSVTPLGPPGAPIGVSAAPGNTQATVSFSPPASNGGSAIVSYTATCGARSASGAGSPLVVTGLANGATVSCAVVATNALGAGPASAPASVTPGTVPDAPGGVVAVAGNAQVRVSFNAPASNGGSAITSYAATCGARTASGASSPIVVTGLTNGIAVTCTVIATNALGAGPPSAPSGSVIPVWRSFTGPVATGLGDATATLSGGGAACTFAPQGNGPLQSAFFIAVTGSPKSPPAGTAPATFPFGLFDFVLLDCDPGSTATISIAYPTAIPAGEQYWKYGPTASQPAPHWYVLPATISGNTATFSITDGGLGDDDLAANGTMVDQGGPGGGGGPGSGVEPVPTLGEWALIALAAMLGLSGMAMRRRL